MICTAFAPAFMHSKLASSFGIIPPLMVPLFLSSAILASSSLLISSPFLSKTPFISLRNIALLALSLAAIALAARSAFIL